MRMRLFSAALLAVACTSAPPMTVTPVTGSFSLAAHAQRVPPLSSGDAVRGRQAFLDLRCPACHRVAEDPSLKGSSSGPLLHDLGKESAEAVGWKIVTQTRLAPDAMYESAMAEAASAMTDRQLVDLVAYLREPKRP